MLLDSNDLFEVNLAVFENKGTIPFDLYIKISDRYIKIVESNNPIFTSFWEKTKEKKVSKVYVKKSDRMEFIRLGLDSSCNKESKIEDKVTSVVATAQQIFQDFEKNGVTSENSYLLKDTATEIVQLMKSDESLKFFLSNIQSDSMLFSHSLMRTVFCIKAAKKLAWGSDLSLSKITFASLVCDLTLKGNFNIVLKDKNDLTVQEKSLFNDHMKSTVSAINNYMKMSVEIESAILHHHEYHDGSGPLGLIRSQIYPLGHLIRIGDEIASKVLRSPENPNPLPLIKVLSIIKDSLRFNQRIAAGFYFNKS